MSAETNHPINQTAMSRVGDLAVLPQVVFKIVEMTGVEDSSAAEIERAIVVDPGFSAKVLQQSNSAFYALPRKVTSIKDAVMFLGLKSVRQIAMNVGVFDLFVGKTDAESLRRRAWWRLSIDTAIAASTFAQKSKRANPEEAYTCGLLHLIGRTLLDRAEAQSFDTVQALIQHGADEEQAERAVYGSSHIEVSVAAAMKWGFPAVLISGLDYRRPLESDDPAAGLRASVTLGHWFATRLQSSTNFDTEQPPQWVFAALGTGPESLNDWFDAATGACANAAKQGMG